VSALLVNLNLVPDPLAKRQRWELSTLPASLADGGDDSQLALIDGRVPDWTRTAATCLGAGASGLFIDHPSVLTPASEVTALVREADMAGAKVVVNGRWLSMAALADFIELLGEQGDLMAIDGLIETPDRCTSSYAELLLEQVTLAQRVAGAIEQVELAAMRRAGYVVVGRQARSVLSLSAIHSNLAAPCLQISAHTPNRSVHLKLALAAPASAAELRVVDGFGSRTLPARYESNSRSCWMRLVDAVKTGLRSDDLDHLSNGLASTAAIASKWSGLSPTAAPDPAAVLSNITQKESDDSF
jgi:hypothetical protein